MERFAKIHDIGTTQVVILKGYDKPKRKFYCTVFTRFETRGGGPPTDMPAVAEFQTATQQDAFFDAFDAKAANDYIIQAGNAHKLNGIGLVIPSTRSRGIA